MTLPSLETERLLLRQIAESDAEGLHAAYGNAEAMRFWDSLPAQDVAETTKRLLWSIRANEAWHGAWAIVSQVDGFVGMINYHHREAWHRRLELGWILAPAFWRRGFMTEAASAVLRHCFNTMETHRVEAIIQPENAASLALVAKLGFVKESGPLRDRWCVNGKFRSVLMYSLLKSDWQEQS